jgi:hypothetical protein
VPIILRRPQAPSITPLSNRAIAATPVPARSAPRHTRRQRREDAARTLAPVIAEIRRAGHHGNAEIAKHLNERGLRAPSGGRFSPETTRKIQQDIKKMGLGDGSRTVSEALSARHKRERARMIAKLAEIREMRTREHPDWDV